MTGNTGDGGSTEGTGKDSARKQLSKSTRQGAEAYQGALEAVLAIGIGAGLGFWADQRYGTAPCWLIVGTIVGFGAFTLRLWRMRTLFDRDPSDPPDGGGSGRS